MAASRKRRKPQRVPRKRRTPDEARRLILDTAEARLREGGPSALHLKEIACDAGISHPTILHHFESREGLVQALLSRGMDRLESALLAVVQTAPPTQETVQAATERIFALMGDAGHARLLALRALEVGGPGPGADEPVLRRLTDVVHARRAAFHVRGQPPISRADSEFLMWLTAAASLGDAIFGPFIARWIGADPGLERESFRARFGRLLFERLGADGAEAAARPQRRTPRKKPRD
jgi:AcrR family transcriptional regulator